MSNGQNEDNDNKNQRDLPTPGGNSWRFIVPIVLVLIAFSLFANLFRSAGTGPQISYTEFRNNLERGNVVRVTVQGERIEGLLKGTSTVAAEGGSRSFTTYIPSFGDPQLMELLEENNVIVQTEPADQMSFLGLLLSILPYVLMVWIMFSLFRAMRGQGRNLFSVGQNKAKQYDAKQERTLFKDVAGLEGAKEEVMEIVDFLKEPQRFQKMGASTPKGVLLVGPPGTGKTLIARAIAGEAGVPFFSISGSDFMEMFVGVGASRVRNLFKEAKTKAPSIVFIDEIDSIGRHRGAGLGGGHDEREQTLNQLLSELDGFEQNDRTIIIAATNRPDILDPALLRPGRFDRKITIGLPTVDEREAILKIHARSKPMDTDVNMKRVAQNTTGFSGADLRNLLNEAALLAARNRQQTVTEADISDARDKVLMGLERRNLHVTDQERRIIAYHEAGHALTAALLPDTEPVYKVTIVPRDRAMGVTQQMPDRERYLYSKEYLDQRITVMLGGRAAEELVFDSFTSGAENDLKQATGIARRMVTEWGMSDKLGHVALSDGDQDVFLGEQLAKQRFHSEQTAREVDEEVRGILHSGYERGCDLLRRNRAKLDKLAEDLLSNEEVSGDQVKELIAGGPPDKRDDYAAGDDAADGDSPDGSSPDDGGGTPE